MKYQFEPCSEHRTSVTSFHECYLRYNRARNKAIGKRAWFCEMYYTTITLKRSYYHNKFKKQKRMLKYLMSQDNIEYFYNIPEKICNDLTQKVIQDINFYHKLGYLKRKTNPIELKKYGCAIYRDKQDITYITTNRNSGAKPKIIEVAYDNFFCKNHLQKIKPQNNNKNEKD